MKSNIIYIIGILLVITAYGCRDDIEVSFTEPKERVGDEDNWVVYNEMTQDLDEDTYDMFEGIEKDMLIFSSMSDQMETFEIGTIINNNKIDERAPEGFLKRIIGVEEVNGKMVYQTEDVTMSEAFSDFSFNFNGSFDEISGKNDNPLDGIFNQTKFKFPTESLTIKVPVSHGSTDSVDVTFVFEMDLSGDLVFEYNRNGQEGIKAGVKNFKINSLKIGAEFSPSIKSFMPYEKDPVFSIPIKLGAIPVGPVVIVPSIEIRAFFNAGAVIKGGMALNFSSNTLTSKSR